jgi:hypothetical protein
MRSLLVVAVLSACGGGAKQAVESGDGSSRLTTEGAAMPRQMSDDHAADRAPTFRRGSPLTPAERLVAWLEGQHRDGKPRLVRLPIVVPAAEVGFDPHRASIGNAPDALSIVANDSFLGISLEMHAKKHCKGQPSCAFWVHGHFRGKVDGKYQFDVTKVESHIDPASLPTADHADVEGDSATAN